MTQALTRHRVIAFALCLLAWACSGASSSRLTLDVGGATLHAEVVDTQASRARGLMYREQLGKRDGMLFVYADSAPRSFWMKDTRIPLSIAFLNRSGKILRIREMPPLSLKQIKSVAPAAYALEVNQGWFEANQVKVGAIVTPLPPLAAE